MTKYIYFHDTNSITLCENDDDAFSKIVNIRKRTPDRVWTLIETDNSGNFSVIINSHNHKRERRIIAIVAGLIIIATIVFVFSCYAGILF